LSNDAIINFNDNTINIDGKFYELPTQQSIDNEMKILVNKTRINSIVETEKSIFNKINNLVKKCKTSNPEIGKMNNITHEINLKSEVILDQPSFRLHTKLRLLVKKEIGYLIFNKIIRPSNSSYGFPEFPQSRKTVKFA
ncbi:hypothetical protein DMUE_4744, partial [Dictyocoela muelleri]